MKRTFILLLTGFATLIFAAAPASAQDTREWDAVKFGFFDLDDAALGLGFKVADISPHLNLNFDADLMLSGQPRLLLDVSVRYHFRRSGRRTLPYAGGGLGVALGKSNFLPGHILGGLDLKVDAIPIFTEIKIHFGKADAVSLWFGVRY